MHANRFKRLIGLIYLRMDYYIKSIHEKYFELLNDYLGSIYRTSPSRNPHEAGLHYSNLYLSGKIIHDVLPDLRDALMRLWKRNKKDLYEEISNLPGLKARYSGDISPSQCFDLVSRTGLYIDTTLVPDPLTKLLNIPLEMIKERHLVYYVVKHAFNILNAKEFFFSDTEAPISVIFPLDFYFDEARSQVCSKEAFLETKEYFEELLGIKLDTEKQLDSILGQNTKTLSSKIRQLEILPPGFLDAKGIPKGLEKGGEEMANTGMLPTEGKSPGLCLKLYVLGRLMRLTDCFLDCISFDAKPLFDVPNSWSMFKWKVEKESFKTGQRIELDISTAVVNALQLDNFKWLGNIPSEKLVQIRNNHELQDLRELFNREVSEIYECNRDELEIVARRVQYNLTKAFKAHEKKLRDIDNEYRKRYRIDSSLVITGVVAAVCGLFWPPAALASIIGGGGLIDLKSIHDERKKQILKTTNKPVGILFRAYQEDEYL